MKKGIMLRIIPLLTILLNACTYSFSGYFPSHLKKVSVHVFQNRTMMYGLEGTVTEYFIEKIREDGRFRIVPDDEAGMVINGSVVGYKKTPFRYDEGGNIQSYNIELRLELEFFDKVNNKPFLSKATYTGNGTFDVSTESEEEGIKRAVEDIYSTVTHKLFQVAF